MTTLSVVLPAYNEEENILNTARTLRKILEEAGIPFELVFVDDGSSDGTWAAILEESGKDPRITGVHFSRNFGKEAAIYAGLEQASGGAVAVMDVDLQHPPQTLVRMYRLHEAGYEIVEGIKTERGKESFLHRKMTDLFYRFMSWSVGAEMKNTSDFKLLDRKVVETILSMPERSMFFRATSIWMGYRSTKVTFDVAERSAGSSKWNTRMLTRYAMSNIVCFTTAPLQFVTVAGIVCLVFSGLLTIYSLIMYFTGHAVEGYTTILIVLLFIGSMIMISLGVIGYYIARIYEEVQHRPRYIVSSVVKGDQDLMWSDKQRAAGAAPEGDANEKSD